MRSYFPLRLSMTRPTINFPKHPFSFGELVHVLSKDVYYARALHELVKYGHQKANEQPPDTGEVDWVKTELSKHVKRLSKAELAELGFKHDPDDDKCSNNTKFYMLNFSRYI